MEIIIHAEDYQKNAVHAAQKILEETNLTEEALQNAVDEITTNKSFQKAKEAQKRIKYNNIAKFILGSTYETENKERNNISSQKGINIIALLFGIISIYNILTQLPKVNQYLDFSLYEASFLFPFEFGIYISLLITSYLFYKRMHAAWYLLLIYISLGLTSPLMEIILYISNYISGTLYYTRLPIFYYLVSILFSSLILVYICNSKRRAIFKVTKNQMFYTIIIISLAMGLYLYFILKSLL